MSLLLVVWPAAGTTAFALLVYQDTTYPEGFAGAVEYVRLTHAVLGGVMIGWFVTLFRLAPLVARIPTIWVAMTTGLVVWFVSDTTYSVTSGFWENAVLNIVVAVLLAPPLLALRPRAART
jgi:predicted membrane-bound dolichyl-phosphate-mannose-protein mannosyltransferase